MGDLHTSAPANPAAMLAQPLIPPRNLHLVLWRPFRRHLLLILCHPHHPRQPGPPALSRANHCNIVSLLHALRSKVPQEDGRKVCRAGFFDEDRMAEREAFVARKKVVEG